MQSVSQRIAGNMNAAYMHPAHVPPTLVPSPVNVPVPHGGSNDPILAQMMQMQERAQKFEERMTTLLEHISKPLSEE